MNYEPKAAGGEERLALEDGTPRARRRRWIIIGVVVLLVLALVWFFLARNDKGHDKRVAAPATAAAQAPVVTVAVPGRGGMQRTVSGTGTLAARVNMPVGIAGEGGRVTAVLVQPGDWVKAGQVLATVDRSVQEQTAQSLEAQVHEAQANAALAQSDLDRAEKLVGRGFISKADIDQKQATRDAAVAQVRVVKAQLGETEARNAQLNVRAPAAGLVLTRSVEPGQIVSSGSGVLFTVAKDGQMEMLAKLGEGDLALVSVGDSATVTPVGQSQSFNGRVWQVEPVIDPQTRQGIARIALGYNKALRPGGFGSATIDVSTQEATVLPDSAIQSDNKGNFVYIVNDKDQAERRDVTVGEITDNGVSVTSGLNGDEKVVLTAGAFLNPGQKVSPKMVTQQAMRSMASGNSGSDGS